MTMPKKKSLTSNSHDIPMMGGKSSASGIIDTVISGIEAVFATFLVDFDGFSADLFLFFPRSAIVIMNN